MLIENGVFGSWVILVFQNFGMGNLTDMFGYEWRKVEFWDIEKVDGFELFSLTSKDSCVTTW